MLVLSVKVRPGKCSLLHFMCCYAVSCVVRVISTHTMHIGSSSSFLAPHTVPTTPSGNCVTGDVRLSEGSEDPSQNTSTGTLQICINNAWGAVCYDGVFGQDDAQVACLQAGGYERDNLGVIGSVLISGPVFLSEVNCEGNEETLLECPRGVDDTECLTGLAPVLTCKGECYYPLTFYCNIHCHRNIFRY